MQCGVYTAYKSTQYTHTDTLVYSYAHASAHMTLTREFTYIVYYRRYFTRVFHFQPSVQVPCVERTLSLTNASFITAGQVI